MLDALFDAIDRKDAVTFAAFLSPNCRFRFGNMPEVSGAGEIESFVSGFFEAIAELQHEIGESFEVPDGLICHGQVSYTRHDGTTLSVPFANIMSLDDDGICDYRIFADTSELFQ